MRVAAIGYASDHPAFEPVVFASEQSILDYDAVVWDPIGLEAEYRDAYTSPGGNSAAPLLSVAASARLLQDVRRRRREIARFLERGRVMVVVPPPPVSMRIHVIEDVIEFHAAEALPQRLRLSEAASDEAVDFSGGHPFREFAERLAARPRARATFDRFPGEPLFFVGPDRAVAGGYVYHHPGHLLFLPLPETTGGPVDEALVRLVSRVGSGGFNLDLPDWSDDYLVPDEAAARASLRDLLSEQETLMRRLEEGRQRVREAEHLKALFSGSGPTFLAAITNVFQELGTIALSGLLSDDSVVVEDGERFLVVLAADGSDEADAAGHLEDRLERFRGAFFSDAKGLVVHSRGVPPEDGVVNDVMVARLAAAGHVYLTGFDLLHLATSDDLRRTALDRMFAASGRPDGLPEPADAVRPRS